MGKRFITDLFLTVWHFFFFFSYFNVVFRLHIVADDKRTPAAHTSYVTTAEHGASVKVKADYDVGCS